MIEPTGYRARCDHAGCTVSRSGESYPALVAAAEAVGWRFNRKLDGTPARRNGRDYCPVHRPKWHLLDALTEGMAARLMVMLHDPVWRPRGAGQWRSARMMADRGLLTFVVSDGCKQYELTDEGRRAGLDVRDRLGEIAAAAQPFGGAGE